MFARNKSCLIALFRRKKIYTKIFEDMQKEDHDRSAISIYILGRFRLWVGGSAANFCIRPPCRKVRNICGENRIERCDLRFLAYLSHYWPHPRLVLVYLSLFYLRIPFFLHQVRLCFFSLISLLFLSPFSFLSTWHSYLPLLLQ